MKKKDLVYDFIRKRELEDPTHKQGTATGLISTSLKMQRSNVSKILNELVRENKLDKSNTRPVKYTLHQNVEKNVFAELIGNNGSLEKMITLAKAAVLYPGGSLGINLCARPGSGSSLFIRKVIEYAKQVKRISEDTPIIYINCRHFANQFDLEKQLFNIDGKDCCQRALNGVLLLEHYEELTSEQLLKLTDLLDKYSEMKIVICSSTIADTQISLPVEIKLPQYNERPFSERLELINNFFEHEAINSNKSIVVSNNVIKALLLTRYKDNIKELKKNIVMACANAYVRAVNGGGNVYVHSDDLAQSARASLIQERNYREELEKTLGQINTRIYSAEGRYPTAKEKSLYVQIDDNYQSLEKQGISDVGIRQSINHKIQTLFDKYNYSSYNDSSKGNAELSKIVPEPIIRMVKGWLRLTEHELNKKYDDNIFYGLCLHLNSMINLNVGHVEIEAQKIYFFEQNYCEEYQAALKLSQMIFQRFKYECDDSEIVEILMFLVQPQHDIKTTPVLLYAMHGDGVARHLSQVVNDLSHESNTYYYDMQLSKNTDDALYELTNLVRKIDQGSGIIVIYDMGSFKVMFDKIMEQTGIKLRLIQIPVSLIGLEIARKCLNDSNIDNIYHSMTQNLSTFEKSDSLQQELVITLCHTGEGGAVQLKDYIDQYSTLGLVVKALNESDRDKLANEVIELQKFYKIRAFVGTFDPKLYGIPFISMKQIFEAPHEKLDNVLMFSPIEGTAYVYDQIYAHFEEEFTYVSVNKLRKVIPVVMNNIEKKYKLTEDQQIGLVTHIGSLVEGILGNKKYEESADINAVIKNNIADFKYLSKCMKDVEKEFDIILTDDMIGTLILIVKQL